MQLATSKIRFDPWSIIQNVNSDILADIWKDLEDSMTVNFAYRTTDSNVGL